MYDECVAFRRSLVEDGGHIGGRSAAFCVKTAVLGFDIVRCLERDLQMDDIAWL